MHLPRRTLFLIATLVISATSGCAATGPTPEDFEATDADLSAAAHDKLATRVKELYEQAVHDGHPDAPLPGASDVDPSKLRGAAHGAYVQYAHNEQDYGYGTPGIMTATVDGLRVYVVSGIISDTGDEIGFYDSRGKTLAIAYSGQGEHPNANGVDWE